MKYLVASVLLCVLLLPAVTLSQSRKTPVKQNPSQSGRLQNNAPHSVTVKICVGIAIPDGYVIVGYESSSACPNGAYLLREDQTKSQTSETLTFGPQVPAAQPLIARPRRVGDGRLAPGRELTFSGPLSDLRQPVLWGTELTPAVNAPATDSPSTTVEEVAGGDVVRIDTNLVTVPVSVFDRQGRLIPNLQRENFSVFENGVEQEIKHFEPTEKPFTVALLLDTSGSTVFDLWEIKEAAIAFAKQLRPQDRVLVVTFNDLVMLLTEATSDLKVVTEVIQRGANTGFSTRLYDAVALVINERLNKIEGRKAIVLFTDGVDTKSYLATYKSTLREAEELDGLIYAIQYDTTDFAAATQTPSNDLLIVTARAPDGTTQRVVSGPTIAIPGTTIGDYQLADRYLHQLSENTGGLLYKANDRVQLAGAFSKIAGELRSQYSLGYYPKIAAKRGERNLIKVRVNQPDLAVRARGSYVQRVLPKSAQ
ncbi:MAG TPA: VWA domain-containing protein [Pyrinomonadaceae bacterium]|nr:VWA domain-containing protein [Pyrinomonadaceae bacterium]